MQPSKHEKNFSVRISVESELKNLYANYIFYIIDLFRAQTRVANATKILCIWYKQIICAIWHCLSQLAFFPKKLRSNFRAYKKINDEFSRNIIHENKNRERSHAEAWEIFVSFQFYRATGKRETHSRYGRGWEVNPIGALYLISHVHEATA